MKGNYEKVKENLLRVGGVPREKNWTVSSREINVLRLMAET